jgi:hypothetical protein
VRQSRLTESHQDVGLVGFLLVLRRRRAREGPPQGRDQILPIGNSPSPSAKLFQSYIKYWKLQSIAHRFSDFF